MADNPGNGESVVPDAAGTGEEFRRKSYAVSRVRVGGREIFLNTAAGSSAAAAQAPGRAEGEEEEELEEQIPEGAEEPRAESAPTPPQEAQAEALRADASAAGASQPSPDRASAARAGGQARPAVSRRTARARVRENPMAATGPSPRLVDELHRIATDLLILAREIEQLDTVLSGSRGKPLDGVSEEDPDEVLARVLREAAARGHGEIPPHLQGLF